MGPGSHHRGPLYIITAPDAETGSTKVEIVDETGNWVGPAMNPTGSQVIATGQTLAVTDANALTVGGVIVPQFIYQTFYQPGATIPATGRAMIAMDKLQLVGVTANWSAAGSTSAAVALYKDPTTDAPGGGVALLTAAIDLTTATTAANANVSPALSATSSSLKFAVGDGLSLVFSGTLTGLTGLAITCKFQRNPA